MESDKYIVAREKKNNIAIINVANPNVVERVPFSVEILSVIMHPTEKFWLLKVNILFIFLFFNIPPF